MTIHCHLDFYVSVFVSSLFITVAHGSHMESNRTWSDVKDQYHRSLIDRKIELRKRLLELLPYPSKYFRWF